MNPRFKVVTVLYRDTPEAAKSFMEENGYTVPVYVDAGENAAVQMGVTGVPETYVVDKEGILRKKIIGPTTFDSPKALGFFEDLLAK